MEIVLAVVGLIGGFLIALGWYKRGMVEVEKELSSLKNRVDSVEKVNQSTYTDIKVIEQRMGYMESKIDEIHSVIMQPRNILP